MTRREPLSPVAGQPNPELQRVTGLQKVLIAVIAVGFFVLIGLVVYLRSVATPLK